MRRAWVRILDKSRRFRVMLADRFLNVQEIINIIISPISGISGNFRGTLRVPDIEREVLWSERSRQSTGRLYKYFMHFLIEHLFFRISKLHDGQEND